MTPWERRFHGAAGVAAAGLALLVLVGAAPAASAHDRLQSASPADGETVAVAPASVVLTFDEPAIAVGTKVVVLGPDGTEVSSGEPRLVDDTVTEDLIGDLPAGTYRVQWRVTSSDGHPVSGEWTFTATGATTGAGAEQTPTPLVTSASASASSAADPAEASGNAGGDGTRVAVVALVVALGALAVLLVRSRKNGRRAP